MRVLAHAAFIGVLLTSLQARAEDCALGKRYLLLAQDRIASHEDEEAMAFFHQSIDACPSYDAYEQLGELAAQSTEQADKEKAVEAFVAADAKAPSPEAHARALYHYAALLNQEGDPQNAYPLIKQARSLNPGNADIVALANTLEQEVQHPSQEHIVRALRYSLYKPLNASTGSRAVAGQGLTKYQTPAGGGGPSVNIPINFVTGSVVLDPETRPNIVTLAKSLADPALAGRGFTFVGHSDSRGGDQYNIGLSLQRAEAVSQSVMAIEPSLKGRIRVEGHGAREPIDTGTDEQAMRANRRLQVLVN